VAIGAELARIQSAINPRASFPQKIGFPRHAPRLARQWAIVAHHPARIIPRASNLSDIAQPFPDYLTTNRHIFPDSKNCIEPYRCPARLNLISARPKVAGPEINPHKAGPYFPASFVPLLFLVFFFFFFF
jgi:hypothetical protein